MATTLIGTAEGRWQDKGNWVMNALMKDGAYAVCTMNGKLNAPTREMMEESCCVVPQCEIRIEECADGCKIYCVCEDSVTCKTLQNLCRSLAGGLCTVCCCWNGMCLCQCDFACCHCTCEMTADGVCICCKTGDKTCQKMIKALCECLCCCKDCGCTCTVCFNNTPVCHCNC